MTPLWQQVSHDSTLMMAGVVDIRPHGNKRPVTNKGSSRFSYVEAQELHD